MSATETDIAHLEDALRILFQTLKRPQHWARIAESAGVQLDRPAAMVLKNLSVHQPPRCRLQDLAEQLGIEAPSVTRKTQALEKAGYVKRVADPVDKRVVYISLTDQGRAICQRLSDAQRQVLQQAMAGWQTADRQQFIADFTRFSHDLARSSRL